MCEVNLPLSRSLTPPYLSMRPRKLCWYSAFCDSHTRDQLAAAMSHHQAADVEEHLEDVLLEFVAR
jgi:hypothetical protein